MAVPTWGMLAKSQTDPETIEEAIARLVQEHNENEEAHLGPGQSLYSHKASEIIDHLVNSVLAEKLHVSAQVAECVVALTGGDYTTIQDALNDGNKRIYVKAGVYVIPSTGITISVNEVEIYGEDKDHVILKAEAGEYNEFNLVEIASNVEDVILKGLTFDVKDAEGIGEEPHINCVYSSGPVKRVLINDCIFKIKQEAIGVYIDNYNSEDIRIFECTFLGSEDTDGIVIYAKDSVVSSNLFNGGGSAITFQGENNIFSNNLCKNIWDCVFTQGDYSLIFGNIFRDIGSRCMYIYGPKYIDLIGNKIFNCGWIGINIGGNARNCSVIGNIVLNCGMQGIEIEQVHHCSIVGNICALNGHEGIRFRWSDYCTFSGNTLYKNSQAGSGTYAAFVLYGSSLYPVYYNSITGNIIDAINSNYGIIESTSYANYNVYIGNVVRNASVRNIQTYGTSDDVAHNIT
jgi:parallel beta-helix repeat protein